MAIADVTIIPIGTKTPSVSEYVADVQNILEGYKAAGKIKFQLTPMNTLIEGELSDLFAVIQDIHEAPSKKGCTEWRQISALMTDVIKKQRWRAKSKVSANICSNNKPVSIGYRLLMCSRIAAGYNGHYGKPAKHAQRGGG
ncbi:MTH1187 family thiamine-binding protein [Bacillus velezensis]|uniref:MTH1187 family thiamine-binding protein n=1 Tax=Bacillus velezensis TaxID=492670 RepID=UPI001E4C262D|nr:MTH1187 family thiamine-binding protein [Bacillus velezensis]